MFPATAGMQGAKCLVLRASSEFITCKRFLHRLVLCEMAKLFQADTVYVCIIASLVIQSSDNPFLPLDGARKFACCDDACLLVGIASKLMVPSSCCSFHHGFLDTEVRGV